jgi:uncharacterized OB-fold protein
MTSPGAHSLSLLHPASVRCRDGDPAEACLVGSRCDSCAIVVFPAMPVCPQCGEHAAMREVEIGRSATLYSFSIARVAPQGFVAPYYQAFVELAEGPRVFSLIGSEVPIRDGVLREGQPMRLVVERLAETPEKRDLFTYKYVPDERHA